MRREGGKEVGGKKRKKRKRKRSVWVYINLRRNS